MEPSEASKIELILGDAIQLLVESGASASITGPFALKFPAKVAQRLAVGEKPPPDQPLDQFEVQELIEKAIKDAVQKTLEAAQKLAEPTPKKVRFKVGPKNAETSVTLPEDMITRSIEFWGGKRAANAAIRKIYSARPENLNNKSQWLTGELQKILSLQRTASGNSKSSD